MLNYERAQIHGLENCCAPFGNFANECDTRKNHPQCTKMIIIYILYDGKRVWALDCIARVHYTTYIQVQGLRRRQKDLAVALKILNY